MNDSSDFSSIQKAAIQQVFTTSALQFPSLASYRSWLESQGGASGVMRTTAVIEADLNQDGVHELIVQFSSYPNGALGLSSNAETPNRLVVFGLDSAGVISDLTATYLPSNTNSAVSLAGQVAGFAIGDINGDNRLDIVYALNRDDGRSQQSNLASNNAVMLSQNDGSFKLISVDAGPGQATAVSDSVMILSRGADALPQVVFSTKALTQDGGAALLAYRLEGTGVNARLQWLGTSAVDNSNKLLPLSEYQFDAGAPTERFLALDDTRGVVQYRVNADSSLIETGASLPLDVEELSIRTAVGKIGEFSTEPSSVKIYSAGDQRYVVHGFEAASYLKPASGAEEVLVVALRLQQISVREDETGDWIVSSLGPEHSLLRFVSPGVYEPGTPEFVSFKSESDSTLRVAGIKAVDLNGDGHQDIAVSYLGGTPSTAIFINSGSGNFYKVNSSALADISSLIRGTRGDVEPSFVSLGPDQVVDLLFVNGPSTYNAGNFYLFHGTGALGTGPDFSKPPVIGFNERYFLENNQEALVAVDTGIVSSGLEYFLLQGSPSDVVIFAPGTRLQGTSGPDVMRAREGPEYIAADAGNDRIYPGEGNDTVFGGDGIDTVIYAGERSQYKLTKTVFQGQQAWAVRDPIAGELDYLVGVEKLEFAQQFPEGPSSEVTLDIEGNPAVAFRLYRAAFAREPDLAGLGYWVDVLISNKNDPKIAPDQNLLLLDIASAFVGSPEFKSLYGDNVPSGDYVLNLYKNTLGRNPLDTNPVTGLPYDAPGYEYWKSVLDAGFTTRQNMFVFFSESTENRNAVAELIGQGIEYIPWSG